MSVSAAKPGVGGGIWVAPKGSTLPTDASTALDSAFKSQGYVSDAGVTRSTSLENTVVKAWGGAVVAVLGKSKTETLRFTLIEANNVDVLGLTFGSATGTLATGITVKSKADISTPHAFVISTILADDVHQRLVIPAGVITNVGDIVYKDDEVIGFELTITAIADSDGVTVYEYQQSAATSGSEGGA